MGTMGSVTAKFVADTSSAEASLTKIEKAYTEAGTAAEKMAAKVKAAAAVEERAAEVRERSVEKWRKAFEREQFEQMHASIAADQFGRAQEMAALKADILSRSADGAAENVGKLTRAMEGSIPKTAAASAAIRVMEGNLGNNVRAAERFIGTIPGLSGLLQTAFPALGAIALLGVVGELIGRFSKFAGEAHELSEELGIGWMDGAIGQLSGLKEAAQQADDVILNLARDSDALKAHGREMEIDVIRKTQGPGAAFRAQASDKVDSITALTKLLVPLGEERTQRQTGLDPKANHSAETPYLATTDEREKAKLRVGELDAQISNIQKHIADAIQEAQGFSSEATAADKKTSLEKRRSAMAADREAASAQMVNWRKELEAEKALHATSLDEDEAFWQKRAHGVKKGSVLYTDALMESNKAGAEAQKQRLRAFVESSIKDVEDKTRVQAESLEAAAKIDQGWVEQQHADEEAPRRAQENAERAFKLAVEDLKAAEKVAEERIKLEESAGQLTRHGAAQQMLAVHQGTFKQWSQLAGNLSTQYPDVPTPGASEELGRYGAQTEQDRRAVEATSALGGLRESADKLTNSFADLPSILSREMEQVFTSINDQLVKLMTTQYQRGDWKKAVQPIFTDASKSALQFGEGSVMKLPGFGGQGKMGTQGNPMWTRSADMIGGGFNPLQTFSSSASSGGSGIGSSIGGLFSKIFGGGQAAGGVMNPGSFYLTGERGPELVSVGSSSRVTNASDTARMLGAGGDHHHHYNIDARGSHDPIAVGRQIDRALAKAAPTLMAGSNRLGADWAARHPNFGRY